MKSLSSDSEYIFPRLSLAHFNKTLKRLGERAGWVYDSPKYRLRRGEPVLIYKDPENKVNYRFCDHLSSHTMRRTAITTMLRLGMDENVVRGISGHAAGSSEFYRYVKISQDYADEQLQSAFQKLRFLE